MESQMSTPVVVMVDRMLDMARFAGMGVRWEKRLSDRELDKLDPGIALSMLMLTWQSA
jgi:hypothetical protein